MKRRNFLKRGLLSGVMAAGAAASPISLRNGLASDEVGSDFDGVEIRLEINDVKLELIDGKQVFMWAFGLHEDAPSIPGPILRLQQGQTYLFQVDNKSERAHEFAIIGMKQPIEQGGGPVSIRIEPGEEGVVLAQAAGAGTFFYLDPSNAPINRVMGLHGIIVVEPTADNTIGKGNIPYPVSVATPMMRTLFKTLGTGVFPGNGWKAGPDRERVWVFNQVDPRWCDRIEQGEEVSPNEAADFRPRYFTLNGNSGFDAAHDEDCIPTGTIGQPLILRTANAGLAWHSPHIHGNHVYEFARRAASGSLTLHNNIREIDTWTTPPGEIAEVLLPFRMPPDIPSAKLPPGAQEKFPYAYPMHCHNEISQTSGGGSYPMGLVTDWIITGPYKG